MLGFIGQEVHSTDSFMTTTIVSSKKRGKAKSKAKTKTQQARNMQKPVYVFLQAVKNDDIYKDYFNPNLEVERRLLKLNEIVSIDFLVEST